MLCMETEIGQWFKIKFLEWQLARKERSTFDDFSEYLGIGRSTLSKWMNGTSRPAKSLIYQVADKLGPEIYDLMNLPRPDSDLTYIIKHWGVLTQEQRCAIREEAENYHAQSDAAASNGGAGA